MIALPDAAESDLDLPSWSLSSALERSDKTVGKIDQRFLLFESRSWLLKQYSSYKIDIFNYSMWLSATKLKHSSDNNYRDISQCIYHKSKSKNVFRIKDFIFTYQEKHYLKEWKIRMTDIFHSMKSEIWALFTSTNTIISNALCEFPGSKSHYKYTSKFLLSRSHIKGCISPSVPTSLMFHCPVLQHDYPYSL